MNINGVDCGMTFHVAAEHFKGVAEENQTLKEEIKKLKEEIQQFKTKESVANDVSGKFLNLTHK